MKVITTTPWQFLTGSLLDPNKLNDNYSYLVDANKEVFSKRYAKAPITWPYYSTCGTGYSDGNSSETRSYRFHAYVNTWIEHLYLDGAMSSGEAGIYVYDCSTNLAPAGITNPILTASTVEATSVFAQEIMVPSGSTYRFELAATPNGAASYTTSKIDLVAHMRTDRFHTGSTNVFSEPSVTFFNEADPRSAANFTTNKTAISQSVGFNLIHTRASKPVFFVVQNITSSTNQGRRLQYVPLVDSSNYTATARRLDTFCVNSTATAAVVMALQNQASSSTSLSVSFTQTSTSGSGFADAVVNLTSANKNSQSSGSLDYGVRFTSDSASSTKIYGYLWID